jgi:hypothetical protein
VSTVAAAIAIIKFPVVPLNNTHVKLGLAIMILIWLQPLLSIVRPKRYAENLRAALNLVKAQPHTALAC